MRWAPSQSGFPEMRRWASSHSDSIEGVGRIVDSGPQWLVSGVGQLWTPIGEGVPDLSSSDGSIASLVRLMKRSDDFHSGELWHQYL